MQRRCACTGPQRPGSALVHEHLSGWGGDCWFTDTRGANACPSLQIKLSSSVNWIYKILRNSAIEYKQELNDETRVRLIKELLQQITSPTLVLEGFDPLLATNKELVTCGFPPSPDKDALPQHHAIENDASAFYYSLPNLSSPIGAAIPERTRIQKCMRNPIARKGIILPKRGPFWRIQFEKRGIWREDEALQIVQSEHRTMQCRLPTLKKQTKSVFLDKKHSLDSSSGSI